MQPHARRTKILFGCTRSFTLATLYKGLFPYLQANGYDVEVFVGDSDVERYDPVNFGSPVIHVVPMSQLPSPLRDLRSLMDLIRLMSSNRYDAIHLSTPKASLLGSIAAFVTRNGPVVFVYRRRVYELMTGIKKRVFIATDRLTSALSTYVVPISREIGAQLQADHICDERKLHFVGNGSSNGIDVEWYSTSEDMRDRASALRDSLKIPAGAPVLLFVGRMNVEKGVDLLPAIHRRVSSVYPDVHLVAAGPIDGRDPVAEQTLEYFRSEPRAHWVGYVSDPRPYFVMSTIFVFPSYFEGFGNVLLEASAMERPALGFSVPGVREAIEDGVSGFLLPEGDAEAMALSALRLLADHELRTRMGRLARERVVSRFSSRFVRQEVRKLLDQLAARGRRRLLRSKIGNAASSAGRGA